MNGVTSADHETRFEYCGVGGEFRVPAGCVVWLGKRPEEAALSEPRREPYSCWNTVNRRHIHKHHPVRSDTGSYIPIMYNNLFRMLF